MSRDAGGTYTLPESDVVVDTWITVDWANTTLHDIRDALTASLARSGNGAGIMNAPLKMTADSVSAPGFAWQSDPDTGIYHIGSGNIGFALNGTKYLDFTTAGALFVAPLHAPNGSAASPGIGFGGDLNTGFFLDAADAISVSAGGTKRGQVDSVGAWFNNTLAAAAYVTTNGSGGITKQCGFNVASVALENYSGIYGMRVTLTKNITNGKVIIISNVRDNVGQGPYALEPQLRYHADGYLTFKVIGTGIGEVDMADYIFYVELFILDVGAF